VHDVARVRLAYQTPDFESIRKTSKAQRALRNKNKSVAANPSKKMPGPDSSPGM
jgi:hypothetical protein